MMANLISGIVLLAQLVCDGRLAQSEKGVVSSRAYDQRQELVAMRFTDGLEEAEIQRRLRLNFERDCTGKSYNQADMQFDVASTLSTFPADKVAAYLQEKPNVCPANAKVAVQLIETKLGKNRARESAISYLSRFNGFSDFSWDAEMWNIRPLLQFLTVDCGAAALAAFKNVYCGYARFSNLDYLKNELKTACKVAEIKCN